MFSCFQHNQENKSFKFVCLCISVNINLLKKVKNVNQEYVTYVTYYAEVDLKKDNVHKKLKSWKLKHSLNLSTTTKNTVQ